jgi:hypothetical protein
MSVFGKLLLFDKQAFNISILVGVGDATDDDTVKVVVVINVLIPVAASPACLTLEVGLELINEEYAIAGIINKEVVLNTNNVFVIFFIVRIILYIYFKCHNSFDFQYMTFCHYHHQF